MKERPILFAGDMVRAVIGGHKTQTRRLSRLDIINRNPDLWQYDRIEIKAGELYAVFIHYDTDTPVYFRCPYGPPGDNLWIRETIALIYKDSDSCIHEDDQHNCPCDGCYVEYRANSGNKHPGEWPDDDDHAPRWTPSIHMPRWASRIILENTDIRVARVQDISEEDAIAEGVGHDFQMNSGWPDYQHIKNGICELTQDSARMRFCTFWDKINGRSGYGWEVNPWVWVVEFKRTV